jgi:hypothetical protein
MSRTLGILALALLLLVCLVASAPARLLGLVLPAGQVVLQGFSGTLWRGSASRCQLRVGPGYLQMGAVQWQLQPASLLLFSPRVRINSRWGSQTLAAEVVWQGQQDIDLYQLDANFPADLVRQFVPVALAGTLSLQVEQLLLRAGLPVEAAGRLVWQNGVWLAPAGPMQLGSYALDFSQDRDGPLSGDVLTLSGPVEASGAVQLAGRKYDVDIGVAGQNGLDPRLQQALSLIARPEGQAYRIKLDGEF